MAIRKTQSLLMPDGKNYHFFGETYYGVCSSAASSGSKTVYIEGFTSECLRNGTKINVFFRNGNTYTSSISLNVSGTGDHNVWWKSGSSQAIIQSYSCVDLIYYDGAWFIVQFHRQEWFGTCSTAASTQTKTVSITGFDSTQLVNGTKVTVLFTNQQSYNGTPKLNVSSTGAKNIYIAYSNAAGKYEWGQNALITFIYYEGAWLIDRGQHATTSNYGVTRLTSTMPPDYATQQEFAATPSLVQTCSRRVYDNLWINGDGVTILDVNTPVASEWDSGSITYDDITWSNLNTNYSLNRMVKTTIDGEISFFELDIDIEYSGLEWYVWVLFNDNEMGYRFAYNPEDSIIYIQSYEPEGAGEHHIKIEFYQGDGAGFVTYPVLKDKLSAYLTLEDLPIYDGSVT